MEQVSAGERCGDDHKPTDIIGTVKHSYCTQLLMESMSEWVNDQYYMCHIGVNEDPWLLTALEFWPVETHKHGTSHNTSHSLTPSLYQFKSSNIK